MHTYTREGGTDPGQSTQVTSHLRSSAQCWQIKGVLVCWVQPGRGTWNRVGGWEGGPLAATFHRRALRLQQRAYAHATALASHASAQRTAAARHGPAPHAIALLSPLLFAPQPLAVDADGLVATPGPPSPALSRHWVALRQSDAPIAIEQMLSSAASAAPAKESTGSRSRLRSYATSNASSLAHDHGKSQPHANCDHAVSQVQLCVHSARARSHAKCGAYAAMRERAHTCVSARMHMLTHAWTYMHVDPLTHGPQERGARQGFRYTHTHPCTCAFSLSRPLPRSLLLPHPSTSATWVYTQQSFAAATCSCDTGLERQPVRRGAQQFAGRITRIAGRALALCSHLGRRPAQTPPRKVQRAMISCQASPGADRRATVQCDARTLRQRAAPTQRLRDERCLPPHNHLA